MAWGEARCWAGERCSGEEEKTRRRCPWQREERRDEGDEGREGERTDASCQMRHETACPELTRGGWRAPPRVLYTCLAQSPLGPSLLKSSVTALCDNMDLAPLDPAYVAEQLSRPPFVTISGVVNVRDLGSYPTGQPGFITKPGLVYRAGEVSHITEEGALHAITHRFLGRDEREPASTGVRQLRDLGVTTVYDLRSETEMHKYETPIPTIEGVEVVHVPVFKTEDYSPEAMAK